MKRSKYVVFQSKRDGLWYFTVIAANGEPTSKCSEPYPTTSEAVRGAKADRRASMLARIVIEK